jgi:hypothetical protein
MQLSWYERRSAGSAVPGPLRRGVPRPPAKVDGLPEGLLFNDLRHYDG